MKRRMMVTGGVAALAVGLMAGPAAAAPPDCNWGELTQFAILELDFDQGAHSASFAGTRRAGLPNLFGQGDLEATCEFIESALVP